MTVCENVALPLRKAGVSEKDSWKRAKEVISRLGLGDKCDRFANKLSGGEQQRVAIARALVHSPDLLLADEPTGNLDPSLSADIMHLFEQFNQVGTSVLIASHDLSLIASLQHRILTLKAGQLVSDH